MKFFCLSSCCKELAKSACVKADITVATQSVKQREILTIGQRNPLDCPVVVIADSVG
jgi:hypothetical protein